MDNKQICMYVTVRAEEHPGVNDLNNLDIQYNNVQLLWHAGIFNFTYILTLRLVCGHWWGMQWKDCGRLSFNGVLLCTDHWVSTCVRDHLLVGVFALEGWPQQFLCGLSLERSNKRIRSYRVTSREHALYSTFNWPQYVKDDDALHRGQFHQFAVHFQTYGLIEVTIRGLCYHPLQSLDEIYRLVVFTETANRRNVSPTKF